MTLKDFDGKFKVISVTPSLDTPVCDLQIHWFNEDAANQPQDVAVLNISMDLPFAIKRFCATGGIDKAQAQTEKLTELVNSLVTLSRMDEEESPLKMAPFPISDAVTETAESFREHALSQGHGLTLAIQPGLTYRGDEYAVRQLVSILLDNAVKYAAPGSPGSAGNSKHGFPSSCR